MYLIIFQTKGRSVRNEWSGVSEYLYFSFSQQWSLFSPTISVYCESIFILWCFCGFYKMHWSMGYWIGFKHYRQQQSMGKLYFVKD